MSLWGLPLFEKRLLRPGWEIWQYPDDEYAPISKLKIVFDGKIVHTFVFDHACPAEIVGRDLHEALKEHGALKERYT